MKPVIPGLRPDLAAVVNRLLSRIHTKPSAANSLEKLYTWGKGELISSKDMREVLAVLVSAELLDQIDEDGHKVAVPVAKKPTLALSDSDRFVLTSRGLERLEGIGKPEAAPAPRAAQPAPAPRTPAPAPAPEASPAPAAPEHPAPELAPEPVKDEPATAPTMPPPAEVLEEPVPESDPAPESGEREAAQPEASAPAQEAERKVDVSSEAPVAPAAPYASLTVAEPPARQASPPGLPVWLSLTPAQLRRAAKIVEELTDVGERMIALVAREKALLDEAAQLDAGLPVPIPVPIAPEAAAPLGPLDAADRVAAELTPPAPAVEPAARVPYAQRLCASEARVVEAIPRDEPIALSTLRAALGGMPEGTISSTLVKAKRLGVIKSAGHGLYQRVA